MQKHIEEKELREWVQNWLEMDRYYRPYSKSNDIPIPELYDILERIPAADVVEVVRCKNCKHSRTDDSNYDCYRCELTPGRAHFASSFCDMGERRNDGN